MGDAVTNLVISQDADSRYRLNVLVIDVNGVIRQYMAFVLRVSCLLHCGSQQRIDLPCQ
jgi:hypothetical protein